jgi:hypothetical protein
MREVQGSMCLEVVQQTEIAITQGDRID